MKFEFKRSILFSVVLIFSIAALFTFQNCSKGGLTSLSATPSANELSTPLPPPPPALDDPNLTDPAPVTPTYAGTDIYLGGQARIRKLFFNPTTKHIEDLGQINFSGQSVGGISLIENHLVAVDSVNSVLNLYRSESSSWVLDQSKTFQAASVFVTTAFDFGQYLFFGASYNNAQVSYYTSTSFAMTDYHLVKQLVYPAGSKSHSVNYSTKTKKLFEANLGENKINIYNVTSSALTMVNSIIVSSPRNVVYDEVYNKIYTVTESNTGPSLVRIYSYDVDNNSITLLDSIDMGLRASDLKINHNKNYLVTLVRETGNESMQLIPLTTEGRLDTVRTKYQIPISYTEPRSISTSDNGEYLFLTPNKTSSSDLVVFKLNFTTDTNLLSVVKMDEFDAGTEGFTCNFSKDR